MLVPPLAAGAAGALGRIEERWCQMPREWETHGGMSTAGPICLRCWSQRPGLTLSCLLRWLIDSDAAAAGVTADPKEAAVTTGLV